MSTEVKTALLSRNALKGLLHIAGKSGVRYHLNGVCVDFDARALIATDGVAMLVVWLDDTAECNGAGQVILPRTVLTAAVKGRGPRVLPLGISDSRFSLGALGGELIDGRFPDWQLVIPRTLSGESATYDPAIAHRMHKAFSDIAGSQKAWAPTLTPNGLAPGLAWHKDLPHVTGLVMPLRPASSSSSAATLAAANTHLVAIRKALQR